MVATQRAEKLYVREGSGFNVYEASNGTFVGLHTPLGLQTTDGEDVCAITLVPQEYYSAMAFADRMKIIVASSLLFVVALMLSRYLSRRFVRYCFCRLPCRGAIV